MHSNSEQKLTSVLKRDKYLRILYIAEEGAAILFCCTFCVNKREQRQDLRKIVQNGQTEPKLQLWDTRRRMCIRREAKFVHSIKQIRYRNSHFANFNIFKPYSIYAPTELFRLFFALCDLCIFLKSIKSVSIRHCLSLYKCAIVIIGEGQ